ncbi:aspartyl/asparaginyl beta-hydroxylase domain-containing protein [Streptoalloteichus hindustanus]|uniref:Aspartyl/Asparaginyl beta-hydroxylase n=1 Tax=Streptoalloteichus hindustanus TaxID=2017 RepID=A0A1M5F2T7_STRHI|nr:aspartyl/asparaginyl beta-hydroxylase domain-containing protein [Streptoalloteichus hindustanus]SHF85900.1 Aspartyl/Asparaginyl beta-hydroxylase [Streptoalloteichus hindustanus]
MAERRISSAARDLARLLLGHSSRYRDGRLQDVATEALREDADGRGWVVRVVNASLRARQRLDYAVRLEPRRVLSRLSYPLRGHASGDGPPRSLSLLCPTRGRVDNVRDFLTSVCRTTAAPGRIEALFYVDSDDPDLPAYRELFRRSRWLFGDIGRCALHVGDPVGVPAAWNQLAEAATGDLLMMANDDQLYVDYGWDAALDSRVAELTRLHPDGVLCLYFDAGQYPEGGCDFPILSRAWYETVGYFTPTIFQQWEVERWLFDIADRLGRLHPVPGVLVEHRHYQDYKAPFDATYQRHRMTREKSFSDHALFLRTEKLREAEVRKLQAVIDRGGAVASPAGEGTSALSGQALPEAALSEEALSKKALPEEVLPVARRHYAGLVDDLHAAGQTEQAVACAELAVSQGVWAHPLHRPAVYRPDLPLREYDPGTFWFDAYLAENHAKLLAELDRFTGTVRLDAVDTVDAADSSARVGTVGQQWDRLVLFADGEWTAAAARSLPVTMTVLSAIPEATLLPDSSVELALLPSGGRVAARCGRSNTALRVEFGLQVGEGVGTRIGGRPVPWPRGRCLVFDDGWEREVWNESASAHVVLSFTVPHPDLDPAALRRAGRVSTVSVSDVSISDNGAVSPKPGA